MNAKLYLFAKYIENDLKTCMIYLYIYLAGAGDVIWKVTNDVFELL